MGCVLKVENISESEPRTSGEKKEPEKWIVILNVIKAFLAER